MPCKDCNNYDTRYKNGTKAYCSYYRDYYEEDDTCSHFSDHEIACKNCSNYNTDDQSGSKCYCTYYNAYYYDDDRCNHFTEKRSSGGCFLTSACCSYKGLPDDCYQLTVLRKYRDEHLAKTEEGQMIIEQYYRLAPRIVEQIEKCTDKEETYDYIFSVIEQCVQQIQNSNCEQVLQLYKTMVEYCANKFLSEE